MSAPRFNSRDVVYLELDLDTAAGTPAGTYRFCKVGNNPPADVLATPSLEAAATQEEKADPSEGIGIVSNVRVVLRDFPDPDAPQTTFWRRLRARDPYYKLRSARILRGSNSDPLGSLQTEVYNIFKISGPGSGDRVTIELTSPFRQLANAGRFGDHHLITLGALPIAAFLVPFCLIDVSRVYPSLAHQIAGYLAY